MALHEILGMVFITIGILFIIIGIFGLYRYKDFYTRASVSSLIDSAGFLFISFGIILYKGISTFSLKIFFLILLTLLLNPLASHFTVRGAYLSGHRPRKEH
ncbi:Cation:proton antiporter [Petrocella atlantisensis]|uniref:Cation:proton antiporter n=1 Tax=Petrocella atlantisensis TaxID=2173034 RepID=A0A3P7NXW7_9FIRM|nr:monovalent cation/H(+) antiporter subunit G [Petrocella atlantisensis]PKM54042.1 MAG: cation:proton antiporter [Firmicutes bacterium HGW-Firmicutes-5]VDN47805.1 Cation:proton antiporter [Petrocella atlantisensis]